MSDNIKQVIVVRTDLNMRRGKEIAQGSHGAMAFMSRQAQAELQARGGIEALRKAVGSSGCNILVTISLNLMECAWLLDIFTKIVLAAKDEADLMEVKRLCDEAGIKTHLVVDAGLTEVPPNTPTALGIGPDYADKIDAITGPNGVHPLKLR